MQQPALRMLTAVVVLLSVIVGGSACTKWAQACVPVASRRLYLLKGRASRWRPLGLGRPRRAKREFPQDVVDLDSLE